MKLDIMPNGLFSSNVYLVSEGKECVVIDCGVKTRDIVRKLQEEGLTVKYILLTHGHVDHIFHAAALREATGAPLCLHEAELELYRDADKNGYSYFGMKRPLNPPEPDILLKDNQTLRLGDEDIQIIHTPGHSPGCICIKIGSWLFTGDTLFAMSVGRTDLYGGNGQMLEASIQNRLYTLDGSLTVYPGHGQATSIAYEKENNPYV